MTGRAGMAGRLAGFFDTPRQSRDDQMRPWLLDGQGFHLSSHGSASRSLEVGVCQMVVSSSYRTAVASAGMSRSGSTTVPNTCTVK
jgi:hypothetical protein